jgi:hypothetical protein
MDAGLGGAGALPSRGGGDSSSGGAAVARGVMQRHRLHEHISPWGGGVGGAWPSWRLQLGTSAERGGLGVGVEDDTHVGLGEGKNDMMGPLIMESPN